MTEAVELYWLPLGAGDGTHLVRHSGRLYEAVVARRQHRRAAPLFHAALKVASGGVVHVIEMAPVWRSREPDRGVVGEGAVGAPALGRSRMFRYEVRRWACGVLPDEAEAVGGPCRLSSSAAAAAHILELVPAFPLLTWGRDEAGTGDMWNSNSLISWLLAGSAHDAATLRPPDGGRAPGWQAGLVLAARDRARAAHRL